VEKQQTFWDVFSAASATQAEDTKQKQTPRAEKHCWVLMATDIFSNLWFDHRYLNKVDSSRHISWQKIYFNLVALVGGTNQSRRADKAGRPIRPAGQSLDVPTLSANTFAVAANITNSHNKKGSTNH
jgi:hypothetical protein